jgi:DNA/RNA-binding domain of Phe-tRNA-synthetase-like protein
MQLRIEDRILEKYPETAIGYLTARVAIAKHDPWIENLKFSLNHHLQEQKIHLLNFQEHPNIATWRKIYSEDFQVNLKNYRSSLEALLQRILSGKNIWNICNVVDLYNCHSILSLLPMGGYDLAKVSGGVTVRYGLSSETFLGLGEKRAQMIQPNHIVYADYERIICWLWNHKDASATCIDETTKHVLFFIDTFEQSRALIALKRLAQDLEKIHCCPLEMGVLNASNTHAILNLRDEK